MIRIIIGKKGTGKTKTIIELANQAVGHESGHVVVIERGEKLRYDITHKARLINSKEYGIKGYEMALGFVSGIAATNYDITHIFIDSLYKLVGDDNPEHLNRFIADLEKLKSHSDISFTITVSEDVENVGDIVKKYMYDGSDK